MKLQIEYLHEGMSPLYRAHEYDAGADVPMWKDTIIEHGKNIIFLGFKLKIPVGYAGFLSLRSSIMGNGVICNFVPFDADFSGEWCLVIYNTGDPFEVKKDERICQLMIMPVVTSDFVTYDIPRRSDGGMGSTGR